MKFILILMIFADSDGGKSMMEVSYRFESEAQCSSEGFKFTNQKSVALSNYKEFHCIAIGSDKGE